MTKLFRHIVDQGAQYILLGIIIAIERYPCHIGCTNQLRNRNIREIFSCINFSSAFVILVLTRRFASFRLSVSLSMHLTQCLLNPVCHVKAKRTKIFDEKRRKVIDNFLLRCHRARSCHSVPIPSLHAGSTVLNDKCDPITGRYAKCRANILGIATCPLDITLASLINTLSAKANTSFFEKAGK